jgi:hypothetical protein
VTSPPTRMVRAKARFSSRQSQRSGSTVSGRLLRVGNVGQATRGGWLPHERARARPLLVGMSLEQLAEFGDLREGAWPVDLQAFGH